MMIDEAIKHCEEVAEQKECKMTSDDGYTDVTMQKCAADHRQLAEWLTQLKEAKRLLLLANADINYFSGKKWEHEPDVLKLIGEDEE